MYLPPLRSSHEECNGRHIIHAERAAGTRGGFAAMALPKKIWGGIAQFYLTQYIVATNTEGEGATLILISIYFPAAMSRFALNSQLSSLEAWPRMQATGALILLGSGLNTDL